MYLLTCHISRARHSMSTNSGIITYLSTSHYYLRIPYGNPQSQINESAARRPHYLKVRRHGENFQEEAHLSFQKDYTEYCELVNQLVIGV
jgi:hypothetical protein